MIAKLNAMKSLSVATSVTGLGLPRGVRPLAAARFHCSPDQGDLKTPFLGLEHATVNHEI